jgi:hypothetical protein
LCGGPGRPYNAGMPDLLFVALTVGFFSLAAGFVTVCDRIVGPDADHGDPQGTGEADRVGDGAHDANEATDAAPLPVGSAS